jgi:hypothetical protein
MKEPPFTDELKLKKQETRKRTGIAESRYFQAEFSGHVATEDLTEV